MMNKVQFMQDAEDVMNSGRHSVRSCSSGFDDAAESRFSNKRAQEAVALDTAIKVERAVRHERGAKLQKLNCTTEFTSLIVTPAQAQCNIATCMSTLNKNIYNYGI
jgi:hypothetical protein